MEERRHVKYLSMLEFDISMYEVERKHSAYIISDLSRLQSRFQVFELIPMHSISKSEKIQIKTSIVTINVDLFPK